MHEWTVFVLHRDPLDLKAIPVSQEDQEVRDHGDHKETADQRDKKENQ